MLKKLSSFTVLARTKSPKTIVVAVADDAHALEAIKWITDEKQGNAILIGCREKIISIADSLDFNLKEIEIIDIHDKAQACKEAVALVKEGRADVLMKGLVDSSVYLKAILNKDSGIAKSNLVTQLAFIESPYYHKIFALTDAGINIYPDQKDKAMMITQSVSVLHRMNIHVPKVALISAVEHATPSIHGTMDAAALSSVIYDDCIVEGPLSVDLAFSKKSCIHKGINTKVGGDVDLIILPEINSANVFYKTVLQMGGAISASILTGTQFPVVFTSRSDSSLSKYLSIMCAISLCKD